MVKTKTCTFCGAAFKCGATEPDNTCWCTSMPNIMPMPPAGDCLCPECLKIEIENKQAGKAPFLPAQTR